MAVTSEIGDGIGRVIHAGRALGHAREVAAKAADSSVARRDDQRAEIFGGVAGKNKRAPVHSR